MSFTHLRGHVAAGVGCEALHRTELPAQLPSGPPAHRELFNHSQSKQQPSDTATMACATLSTKFRKLLLLATYRDTCTHHKGTVFPHIQGLEVTRTFRVTAVASSYGNHNSHYLQLKYVKVCIPLDQFRKSAPVYNLNFQKRLKHNDVGAPVCMWWKPVRTGPDGQDSTSTRREAAPGPLGRAGQAYSNELCRDHNS